MTRGVIYRRFVGWVALLACGHVATAADVPVLLPPVQVKGDVPLVKVGEFKMRAPRFAPAAVAFDHYLYIIGGAEEPDTMSATVERFDVRTGISEPFAELHIPRFWHQAAVVGDKAYVIGGSVIGPPLPNEARFAEALAKHRGGAGSAPISSPIAFVEVIDLKTGAVSYGPPLSRPVSAFACVAVGDQIAVLGGKVRDETTVERINHVSVFETGKGTWMSAAGMPTARSDVSAVASGPFVIVPGGYNGSQPLDVVEVFDLRTGKWRAARPLCRPSSAGSAAILDKYLFIFGDYDKPGELLVYNLARETSETFTLGYRPARHAAAVVLDRRIYVIGGRATAGDLPLDTIQVFALRKDLKAAPPK